MQAAERHLRRLARRAERAAAQADAKRDDVLAPIDRKPHPLVVDVDETGERLQRVADRGLLARHQRHRAEIGERAAFGHQEAEFLDAGRGGRSLQQPPQAGGRDAQVGAFEGFQRQAHLAHHRPGVDAHRLGNLRIVRKSCAADQIAHGGYASICPEM